MEFTLPTRFKNAWNAFRNNRDPTNYYRNLGPSYSHRPDRPRLTRGKERSFISAVFNRMALDAASISIQHCRLDEEGRYVETIDSPLNTCLTLEANLDQTSRAFMHDVYMSMFDEGCIAICPIDTDIDPETGSYDIYTMRTGKIIEWYPEHIRVKAYNERTAEREEVKFSKRTTAIVENPFYAVMNESNSTLQRLIRKLMLLDVIDEQSGSGKLDLIIQLPYVIKSPARKQQAEDRRKDIETQLSGSKYGIAYTDGTEKITQLNRPVENNLMKQIEYLTNMVFSQLSITQSILDGTADDATMTNYYTRTIEPLVSAVTDEMKRKFLTKTARTQKQSIMWFRDPFKLVAVTALAEIADKFTRNEILSKNEIRQMIGRKPSKDPKADQLINSNISQPNAAVSEKPKEETVETDEGGKSQNGEM